MKCDGMGKDIKIKLYGDGANLEIMKQLYRDSVVSGFTTNPTLMKAAGVTDYKKFGKEAVRMMPDVPISFEVFSDDLSGMEMEARNISSWGANVYVKIPVTNTRGESTAPLIQRLARDGLKLNVTAILTIAQVREVAAALSPSVPSVVSIFAGRIADTGVDPVPTMAAARDILAPNKSAELLWASSREVINILQAESCGCHIITVTPEILKKLPMLGKDLTQLSLETVRMFYNDAKAAGLSLENSQLQDRS